MICHQFKLNATSSSEYMTHTGEGIQARNQQTVQHWWKSQTLIRIQRYGHDTNTNTAIWAWYKYKYSDMGMIQIQIQQYEHDTNTKIWAWSCQLVTFLNGGSGVHFRVNTTAAYSPDSCVTQCKYNRSVNTTEVEMLYECKYNRRVNITAYNI